MTGIEPPDQELLGATVDVADAFDVFFGRHHDAVLVHLVDRAHSLHSAVDLVPEVFAAAYLERTNFDGQDETAEEWLIGIADNKLAASRRRWRRQHTAARRELGIPRLRYSRAALEKAAKVARDSAA
jgi:DNA-directed RNA polymerase specialized sigma24 family protein